MHAFMQQVGEALLKNPQATVTITGHTWRRGGELLNKRLSQRQAALLQESIIREHSIDATRIVALGAGSDSPIMQSSPRDALNRRLEVAIYSASQYSGLHAMALPEVLQSSLNTSSLSLEMSNADAMREEAYSIPKAYQFAPYHNGVPLIATTLHFSHGQNRIHASSVPGINSIVAALLAHADAWVELVGHTDSQGEAARNLALSKKRAGMVQEVLATAYGVAEDRIRVSGVGELQPIENNTTEKGRAGNRRVEAVVKTPRSVQAHVAAIGVAPGVVQAPRLVAAVSQTPGVVIAGLTSQMQTASGISSVAHTSNSALPPRLMIVGDEVVLKGPAARKYQVEVSLKKCRLWVYSLQRDGTRNLVREYTVATAKPGMDHPEGKGYVTKIDTNPWWYPTVDMKRRAARQGKSLKPVAPGKRGNPMGSVKIHLSHGPTYRIHGTNRPKQIGRRVSLGCIRMHNKDGLELAALIDVGTEVNVVF